MLRVTNARTPGFAANPIRLPARTRLVARSRPAFVPRAIVPDSALIDATASLAAFAASSAVAYGLSTLLKRASVNVVATATMDIEPQAAPAVTAAVAAVVEAAPVLEPAFIIAEESPQFPVSAIIETPENAAAFTLAEASQAAAIGAVVLASVADTAPAAEPAVEAILAFEDPQPEAKAVPTNPVTISPQYKTKINEMWSEFQTKKTKEAAAAVYVLQCEKLMLDTVALEEVRKEQKHAAAGGVAELLPWLMAVLAAAWQLVVAMVRKMFGSISGTPASPSPSDSSAPAAA